MKPDSLSFPTCRLLAEFLGNLTVIPRYTLSDLVVPAVCEGIVSRIKWEGVVDKPTEAGRVRDDIARAHYSGGIEAVEVVLLKLLERKL